MLAVAGATGFVGTAACAALSGPFSVIGLTRSPTHPAPAPDDPGALRWRRADLYSLLQVERALEGVDVALYLVHSMLPSARLTQGSFADLDLLLADTFARGAARAGVRQIVYLGGLLPPRRDDLSAHLRSRYEVEQALAAHGVPLTALRAGLVVGPGGSSLRILVNLVRRLPAMVLPAWTRSRTQPIALPDVLRALYAVAGRPQAYGRVFDVGGPDVMTYAEMLDRTAAVLGVRRPAFGVPLVSPRISKLWVSVVTGSPRALAEPLVESLRHDMVVRDNPLMALLAPEAIPFEAALRASVTPDGRLLPNPRHALRRADAPVIRRARRVRSVQRMPLPPGRDAAWAADEYLRWLPRVGHPLLHVEVDEAAGERPRRARFMVRPLRRPLLELEHAPRRSDGGRALFYVVGGLLARAAESARLEFRAVLEGRVLLAAIHDFTPRLPWRVYRLTQATAHTVVMAGFRRHLRRLARRARPVPSNAAPRKPAGASTVY
ncbi:MAG: NAD(P)H-binding protein [Rubricoccaceae bacterium]